MPVQIPPGVKRIESAPTPSVGRIQADVPETAQAFGQVTKAATGAVGEFADYLDDIEKQVIESKATEASNAYHQWYKERLEGNSEKNILGLNHIKGDPTQAYNQFDEEASEKLSELSQVQGLSARGQIAVKKALANKHNVLYDSRLTSYGNQYSKYRHTVTDGAVELEKTTALEATGLININDPSSTVPFDGSLGRIGEHRIKLGLEIGTAAKNEKGKYMLVDDEGKVIRFDMNDSLKYEIKKDKGEAVYNSLMNLVNADKVDEAEYLAKNYSSYLDPVNKAKITEALDKAKTEQKAYKALAGMEDLPYDQQKKKLKDMKTNDPKEMKIKQKALEFLAANERHKNNIARVDSKEAYDYLANKIEAKQRSANPYSSKVQLERDPEFKRMVGRVTDAKQRKALYNIVEKPETSDPEVFAELMTKVGNGELYGMAYPDLASMQVGLSQRDARMFDNEWKKQNTDTESQERSRVNSVASEFRRQYIAAGLLKYDRFKKATPQSLQRMNQLMTGVLQKQFPKGMPQSEQKEWVKEVVSEIVTREKAAKGDGSWFGDLFNRFFGSKPEPFTLEPDDIPDPGTGKRRETKTPIAPKPDNKGKSSKGVKMYTAPTKTVEPDKINVNNLTVEEMSKYRAEYKKANGKPPDNVKALESWLNSRGTK